MQKAVGIIAAALTLAAAQAATAADLGARIWPPAEPVYKAAPAMRAIYSWTGFYAGGNIGYSWGKAKTDVTTPGFTVDALDTAGGTTFPVGIPGSAFSESLKPNGVIGGGQVGWNSQFGNWVLGLEADLQASGQKDDQRRSDAFAFTDITNTPTEFDVAGTSATSLEAKLKWFGTVRGRLGYSWDSVLVYATGGLAYGKFDLTGVNTVAGTITCSANCMGAPATTVFSNTTAVTGSKNKAGWTIGAGIEGAAFLPNWTWKAEYLYLDFGKFDHSFATSGGVITTSTHATDHILRFGVNYRFAGGKGPVVASW
jgi:outer membrane immunogenic protein